MKPTLKSFPRPVALTAWSILTAASFFLAACKDSNTVNPVIPTTACQLVGLYDAPYRTSSVFEFDGQNRVKRILKFAEGRYPTDTLDIWSDRIEDRRYNTW